MCDYLELQKCFDRVGARSGPAFVGVWCRFARVGLVKGEVVDRRTVEWYCLLFECRMGRGADTDGKSQRVCGFR